MSAPTPVWHAGVDEDGRLRLDSRSLFDGYVSRLKGQRVTVTVKKATRSKSRSQLGYLFGVVYPVIAEELGYREYEVDDVHDAVMRELRGLQPEPNPLLLRVSLATMSHDEVSAYIEDVRHWAVTQFGIVTPEAARIEEPGTRARGRVA